MPPLPKKQLSKAKQRSRAAHYKFRPVTLTACGQCHQLILPYRVCPYCGYYKGRQVISVGGTQKRG